MTLVALFSRRPTSTARWTEPMMLVVAYLAGIALLGGHSFVSMAWAIPPDEPPAGDVFFAIDGTGQVKPISPYIYGVNGSSVLPSHVQGVRLGGNRWTGYNWETNSSNAGSDWFHYNDALLVDFQNNTPAGEAVRPTIEQGAALGHAVSVTIPIAGYVAADNDREVFPNQTAPSSRWHQVIAKKSSVTTEPLRLDPDRTDDYVFTDEFVHWIESRRQSQQTIFYTLDNEPGLWDSTHPRLYGSTNPTFADLRDRTINHASAIKDVAPDAKVFGGVLFGWSSFQQLHDAPDFEAQVPGDRAPDDLHFVRWFLQNLAAEETRQGRTLVDALDLHWYPEAQANGQRITFGGALDNSPAVADARMQAPRSLWDSSYTEESWITQWVTSGESLELLPRVQGEIDAHKPGTKIAISEYNYGGGNHISGAIAQADFLGIMGRDGVYAANWWRIEPSDQVDFTRAAFEMFTDFDGQGGQFGDLSLLATTDDNHATAVYASRSADKPGELIIVAINRTDAPLDASVQIREGQRFTQAEVFQLAGSTAVPQSQGTFALDLVNAFVYQMPAFSVSTIRLTAAMLGDFNDDGNYDCHDIDALVAAIASGDHEGQFDLTGDGMVNVIDRDAWLAAAGAALLPNGDAFLPGDANLDGVVDNSDFNLWNSHKFTADAGWCGGDFNADGVADGSDFNVWNANKFRSALNRGPGTVPEPSSWWPLGPCVFGLLLVARHRPTRREPPRARQRSPAGS